VGKPAKKGIKGVSLQERLPVPKGPV